MSELISVIIPVYNVAEYLDPCMESVVAQTYRELEIILVDDGSTDTSGSLCDEWAKKDSRIRVIHQPNGGLSAARNSGLAIAAGQYIAFVDSDDLIHPQCYELLYHALTDHQADVSICRENAFYDEPQVDTAQIEKYTLAQAEDTQQLFWHFCEDFTGQMCWAWNKLYRRELIGTSRYEVGKLCEDVFFNSLVLSKVQKAVWIDDRLVYYRQRKTSLAHAKRAKVIEGFCEAYLYQYQITTQMKALSEDFRECYLAVIYGRLCTSEAEAWYLGLTDTQHRVDAMIRDFTRKTGHLLHSPKEKAKLALYRYLRPLYHRMKQKGIEQYLGDEKQ